MKKIEEGLTILTEALALAQKTGERFYEAEREDCYTENDLPIRT